jgi:cell volume regulation protein A
MFGTLVLRDGVADARRRYDIVFLVVATSVLVQGASAPFVGRRLDVPVSESA